MEHIALEQHWNRDRFSTVRDEIHEVLKEPPPADFAPLNSEKSGGGLVLIVTNLTAGYNLSHAS